MSELETENMPTMATTHASEFMKTHEEKEVLRGLSEH